jgi:LuxR family maltose regulon positive regulatory protein
MLRQISAENGFLASLDEARGEYQFHPLFRDFLYKLLCESDRESLPDLYYRAGAWYREQGEADRAIAYFLSAGSYRDALGLLKCGQILYSYQRYETMLPWLERLPESFAGNSFKIAFFYAMYYAEIGITRCHRLDRENGSAGR